jgi:hypothetical protein
MIDDAWKNTGKMVECMDKVKEHERVAEYWEKKAEVINLSMPEERIEKLLEKEHGKRR